VELQGAHQLQCFAFTGGKINTLIVFNLSRTSAHAIMLGGENAPAGDVTVKTLTSGKITDNNESADNVRIVAREEHNVTREKTVFSLPPFSMTTFSSSRGSVAHSAASSAK
jgi:alpha-L-arabinofuranosidase